MKTIEKYKINLEKTHVQYKMPDGSEAVGVTTLLQDVFRFSYGLVVWGWKEGIKGNDITKTKEKAADIGTITHALIMCHFGGMELDTSNLIPDNLNIAENAFLSFLEWLGKRKIEPVAVEKEMVSSYGYGGTPDLIGIENGEYCLYDFKSGSGIYDDHYWQACGGYRPLAWENGYPVTKVKLIHIPKDENIDFGEIIVSDKKKLNLYQDLFLHALEIYKIKKQLKGK
ncbi:hypothetical protein LLG07_06110 [bacterium]|nr:hypothetical protein [bacterium]